MKNNYYTVEKIGKNHGNKVIPVNITSDINISLLPCNHKGSVLFLPKPKNLSLIFRKFSKVRIEG